MSFSRSRTRGGGGGAIRARLIRPPWQSGIEPQINADTRRYTYAKIENRFAFPRSPSAIRHETAPCDLGLVHSPLTRTYFIYRHVCDGGDAGCSSRRRARRNMSIFRGTPTKKCARIAPSLRVAARTVGCVVALLDHIDIWPSSGALHPVRPGRNASRAYI
jgi:hypothetical protein